MKLKKTATITAPSLMLDDHIKMGGKMYRIRGLVKNELGGWVIYLYSVKSRLRPRNERLTLIVPSHTSFTIYNQK